MPTTVILIGEILPVKFSTGFQSSGLAPGDLHFSNVPAASLSINPGIGTTTGLDAFFALPGQ